MIRIGRKHPSSLLSRLSRFENRLALDDCVGTMECDILTLMNRRTFLQSALSGSAAALLRPARMLAALPKMKIKRIRFFQNPLSKTLFNQSFHIVTVETDSGLTGIGEGGSRDTVEQCAQMIIGEDPLRIDHLWQVNYRGYFYPPGREKLHAQGAIDMALWDIKGKALGVPVWQLLGGQSRGHIECYSTGFPRKGSLKETARACVEAGFRAFRTSVADPGDVRDVAVDLISADFVRKETQEIADAEIGDATVGFSGGVIRRIVERNREYARALTGESAVLHAVAASAGRRFPCRARVLVDERLDALYRRAAHVARLLHD